MVKLFKEISSQDVSTCGGKGASLGELMRAGFPFSDGYVLTTEAYGLNHMQWKDEVYAAFDKLGTKYVAVRSSATKEDSIDDSFAGQFETYLFVDRENLIDQIMECHASINTDRIKAYCESKGIDRDDIKVAVVIQKMVNSEVAGVSFTVNPVTNNTDQIIIEGGRGLGEAVVSGMVTPDNYVWSKKNQKITNKSISIQSKKLVLDLEKGGMREEEVEATIQGVQKMSDEHIITLARLSNQIEEHYGKPMDIEWALEDGDLYILQARPITTFVSENSLSSIFSENISLTERFEEVDGFDAKLFKQEDLDKRKRLSILHDVLGVPFQKAFVFELKEVNEIGGSFEVFYDEFKDRKVAVRLRPKKEGLPKYRTRGLTLELVCKDRIKNQEIQDSDLYVVEIREHFDTCEWSTTFCVCSKGIVGEIIYGGHHQLTQGLHGDVEPIFFLFNGVGDIVFSRNEPGAKEHIEEVLRYITIESSPIKSNLQKSIEVDFWSGYLQGYFETVSYPEQGVYFNDWNRLLPQIVEKDFPSTLSIHALKKEGEIAGQSLLKVGLITGEVCVVEDPFEHISVVGKILVCSMTTAQYLPLMKQAKAIITNQGGMLSHAAIICRELGKPCIVGTRNATQEIKNGVMIEMNTDSGIIKIIEINIKS